MLCVWVNDYMEVLSRKLYYISLLELYSSLLSKTQDEILYDYFYLDLSLKEIGENRNISRSAVEDAIKKGTKRLEELEEKLHMKERNEQILKKLSKLKQIVGNSKDLVSMIEEIEREI